MTRRGEHMALKAKAAREDLYRWLVSLAATGGASPTDEQVMARLGLSSRAGAGQQLRRLASEGLIRIDSSGRVRAITIVATGARLHGTSSGEALYGVLLRAAKASAPTPSLHEMAKAAGYEGPSGVRDGLARLIAEKRIAVSGRCGSNGRVVHDRVFEVAVDGKTWRTVPRATKRPDNAAAGRLKAVEALKRRSAAQAETIFDVIAAAAACGGPTPGLAELSQRIGRRGLTASSTAVAALCAAGRLDVETDAHGARVYVVPGAGRTMPVRRGPAPKPRKAKPSAPKPLSAKRAAPKVKAPKVEAPKAEAAPAAPAAAPTAPPPVAKPVPLVPRPGIAKGCQWISGDPRDAGFGNADALKCGEKTLLGRPYCAAHEARAWSTPAQRRAELRAWNERNPDKRRGFAAGDRGWKTA